MKQDLEIVSLNADELDIEELERRLELALGLPITTDLWCTGHCDACGVHCNTQCAAQCPNFVPCGAANCPNFCGSDCSTFDPDPCPRLDSCPNYNIP